MHLRTSPQPIYPISIEDFSKGYDNLTKVVRFCDAKKCHAERLNRILREKTGTCLNLNVGTLLAT